MIPTETVHIIKLRELLEYRKDNIIYFIDTFGYQLDEGARRLTSIQRYARRENYIEDLNIIRRKNKYLFEIIRIEV